MEASGVYLIPAPGTMKDISFQRLLDLSVIKPGDPPALHAIYRAATENLDLSALDYLTIRDLLSLAGIVHIHAHLLLLALFASLAGGNVCLEISPESLDQIIRILDPEGCDVHIADIEKSTAFLEQLIHTVDTASNERHDPQKAYRPLVLVSGIKRRFLYFHRYYEAERSLLGSLAEILNRRISPLAATKELASAAKTVLDLKPLVVNGAPALLNDAQMAGIILPSLRGLTLISGGPGTGKTFIALTMLRFMTRLGITTDRIRLAAPTGRAAQRLTEAIQRGIGSLPSLDDCDESLASLKGTTLHRLLRYSPSGKGFLHNRNNRIPADLVIIDEASMIDITLLAALLESLECGTRLVMMGDRNQLPSVEAGAVLADLVSTRGGVFSTGIRETIASIIPGIELATSSPAASPPLPSSPPDALQDAVIILDRSYRSGKDIQAFAVALESGSSENLSSLHEANLSDGFPEQGAWRIEPGSLDPNPDRELELVLTYWKKRHYPEESSETSRYIFSASPGDAPDEIMALLSSLEKARILTPLTYGRSGTAGINTFLSETIGPRIDPVGSDRLYAGMPIMILRNDYNRELFNGDVGIILKGGEGNYYAAFGGMEGPAIHLVENLPPYETAYAITIHKSQGSEYDEVLIVLPDTIPETMMNFELLYTAVTRAKKLVILYARRSTLQRAAVTRTTRISRIPIFE